MTLITTGADPSLSEDIRDAVLARLVIADGPVAEAAAALDAVLDDAALSPGELTLMREWLRRLGQSAVA